MPAPINFSVAPAQRAGAFQTTPANYPGGYALLQWSLTGLGAGPGSDYENPAHAFNATVLYSLDGGATYLEYSRSAWHGGPTVHNGVTDPPPTMAVGLGNLPANCLAKIVIDLSGTMTVGITGSFT
jgi:hypothetical protein